MSEQVNHPKHYNQGKIEVIEFIEDKQLGFHLGNSVKYICRAGKKDPAKTIEDLQKAKWYIDRQIEILKPVPRRPNDMNPAAGQQEAPPKKPIANRAVVSIKHGVQLYAELKHGATYDTKLALVANCGTPIYDIAGFLYTEEQLEFHTVVDYHEQ